MFGEIKIFYFCECSEQMLLWFGQGYFDDITEVTASRLYLVMNKETQKIAYFACDLF